MPKHNWNRNACNSESNAQESITNCPECNSLALEIDLTRGEKLCQDCGLVLEENIVDENPFERGTSQGPGEITHGRGFTTSKDWAGQAIPSQVQQRFRSMERTIRTTNAYNSTEYHQKTFNDFIKPLLHSLSGISGEHAKVCEEMYLAMKGVSKILRIKHQNSDRMSGKGADSNMTAAVLAIILAMEYQRNPTQLLDKVQHSQHRYSTRKNSSDVLHVKSEFMRHLDEGHIAVKRLCDKTLTKFIVSALRRINRVHGANRATKVEVFENMERDNCHKMLNQMLTAVCDYHDLPRVQEEKVSQLVNYLQSEEFESTYPRSNAMNHFLTCNAVIVHRYLRNINAKPKFSLTYPKVLDALEDMKSKDSYFGQISRKSPTPAYIRIAEKAVNMMGAIA